MRYAAQHAEGWAASMPKFIVSSFERAAHNALFGFAGQPADLVLSVLDPEAALPTDFVKGAALIGWNHLRHSRVDLYDTLDPVLDHGGVNEPLLAKLKDLALSVGESERVLVHCRGGVSRSPAVVIALLAMRAGSDWPLAEAAVMKFLQDNAKVRPNALLVSAADRLLGYAGKLEQLVCKHRA